MLFVGTAVILDLYQDPVTEKVRPLVHCDVLYLQQLRVPKLLSFYCYVDLDVVLLVRWSSLCNKEADRKSVLADAGEQASTKY